MGRLRSPDTNSADEGFAFPVSVSASRIVSRMASPRASEDEPGPSRCRRQIPGVPGNKSVKARTERVGPGQGGNSRQSGVEGRGRQQLPPHVMHRGYGLLGFTSELKLHYQPLAIPVVFDARSRPYPGSTGASGRMTDLIVRWGVTQAHECRHGSEDLDEILRTRRVGRTRTTTSRSNCRTWKHRRSLAWAPGCPRP